MTFWADCETHDLDAEPLRARFIDAKLDAIAHDLAVHPERVPVAAWPDLYAPASFVRPLLPNGIPERHATR